MDRDRRRGAVDLSDIPSPWGDDGATHEFVPIGEPGAATLTEEQIAERYGIELPDSPLALWHLADAAAVKLGRTPVQPEPAVSVARSVEVSERLRRRLDGLSATLHQECDRRSIHREAGYLNMHTYLCSGHRLGPSESKRRMALARNLVPRTTVSGEPLEPVLPETAAAVAEGQIGAPHAVVIAAIMKKVLDAVEPERHAEIEKELAEHARNLSPAGLTKAGARLLTLIDPDGAYTEPRDRLRQRDLHLFPQDDQLVSRVRGHLTPAARAKLDLLLEHWAAPGALNPEDPDSPHPADDDADRDALTKARERDERSSGQRNHDAFEAMLDFVLANQGLGPPGPIPSEIVISITDADLARKAGVAVTATGTLIPVAELIELAAQATPYLAVFRQHTRQALYLGRAKKHRFANKAQRLMLLARDGGCTAPGCEVPFSRTQAHHSPDWTKGGRTDIDAIGASCGGHNLRVGPDPGQWETELLVSGPNAGRMVWRPAAVGAPWTLNPLHRPEQSSDHRAHAPPDDRSRVEKALEARWGLAYLTA
ncbi:HNH endonuclease signature motif containing protein [Gordonia hirsuta]|nr:HNH endonuclease signature motif containing protein [Gordonia hirsuta]